jgi:hypothetical protein
MSMVECSLSVRITCPCHFASFAGFSSVASCALSTAVLNLDAATATQSKNHTKLPSVPRPPWCVFASPNRSECFAREWSGALE